MTPLKKIDLINKYRRTVSVVVGYLIVSQWQLDNPKVIKQLN